MEEITEEPIKKKRGRPRKIEPHQEFPDYIKNMFADYITTYNNIINIFINSTNRIDKTTWNIIKQHVSDISEIIYKLGKNSFLQFEPSLYTYRTESQWRGIDQYRENFHKNFIRKTYNDNLIPTVYKNFLIFTHIKLYIKESAKEMLV